MVVLDIVVPVYNEESELGSATWIAGAA